MPKERAAMRTHYPAPATPAMKESCPLACPAKRSNSAANTDTCCPQSLSNIVCKRGMSTYPGNTRPGSGRWTLSAPSIAEHYLPIPSGAKWPGQLGSDSHLNRSASSSWKTQPKTKAQVSARSRQRSDTAQVSATIAVSAYMRWGRCRVRGWSRLLRRDRR